MKIQKAVRAQYGHFFYRFPNGESAADVYDRITGSLPFYSVHVQSECVFLCVQDWVFMCCECAQVTWIFECDCGLMEVQDSGRR